MDELNIQRNLPVAAMRIIWAAMLIGEMAFAAVTMLVIWPRKAPFANPAEARLVTIIAAIMMVVVLPLAFVLRRIIRGPSRPKCTSSARYLAGNIAFMALCEAVALIGIMAVLVKGTVGEQIVVPAIAIALQIVNYPAD